PGGVMAALVRLGGDLPPVERWGTGGMADDALSVGPERVHHLVRTTGDPLAFEHAWPLVRIIGGGAYGVEVEVPLGRDAGDRHVGGRGRKFGAQLALRRVGA